MNVANTASLDFVTELVRVRGVREARKGHPERGGSSPETYFRNSVKDAPLSQSRRVCCREHNLLCIPPGDVKMNVALPAEDLHCQSPPGISHFRNQSRPVLRHCPHHRCDAKSFACKGLLVPKACGLGSLPEANHSSLLACFGLQSTDLHIAHGK